ncbi:MAG TPA: hypothetical protein VGW11_01425 [Solirubrobacteraceae bacterium]|nr:hypothetical protein [Solirubrobacteraceae bacterium]
MQRISIWLWVALGGAVLQGISLGSDFYITGGERKGAWQGIPHTSDLLFFSTIAVIVLLILAGVNRSPLRGRTVGLAVGIVGLLAALQLGYRMIVPPFGCLTYGACGFSGGGADVTLLTGIWVGLVGSVAVALGGFLHAFTGAARRTPARPPVAARQEGMTPWLGLAALSAVGMFVFGFTIFSFYTVTGFLGQQGTASWSGWLSIPHTSSLVLALGVAVLVLAVAAARNRAPLSPASLGALVGVLGFIAATRILFRMFESPFTNAGGGSTTVGSVTIQPAGYVSLAFAVLVVVAGIVQAVMYREETAERREPVGEPVPGSA